MNSLINIEENGLKLVFQIAKDNSVKFLHFSTLPFDEKNIADEEEKRGFRLVEVMVSGLDRPEERHGNKYVVTAPGYKLKYKEHKDDRNELGRKIEIVTFDKETTLKVTSHFQFYDNISVVRSWTEVQNYGDEIQNLEYVSSFNLTGIEKEGLEDWDKKMKLYIPHNSWTRELQWRSYTLPELGFCRSIVGKPQRSSKAIGISNTGAWSTKEYIPMGYLENMETDSNIFWQIENNGSWHWEISDQTNHIYLQLSGPTETESHWSKKLKPKEIFVSVPVAVGATVNGFDNAMGELTRYRRKIRRPNEDNEKLGVIFNDYMNCLFGDPTTEKLLPLIDAAAEVGSEYFCIDAGWYSKGEWWDGVGEWMPSKERFPGGIKEVLDYIREKGLIPGLWLELEVMGIKSPKLKDTEDSWFFMRHGKRVHDRSRYQLDYRNPAVIKHANSVIDRLVNEYGVGYIKMDYNIEPGIGTETDANSFGDGLLEHNRAYIKWLGDVFKKYPKLIIENCSSGGLRIDYAMLSLYSIQSTSDQEDYKKYATIAANSPTAVTPEQSAIWSYPLTEGNDEEVIFNMINVMLVRIHQSGHLANISDGRKGLVKEAINYYKTIRKDIKEGLPFWPLGLSGFEDNWVSLGMKNNNKTYVSVWRRDSASDICYIPIKHLKGKDVEVKCGYPAKAESKFQWNKNSGILTVSLTTCNSARLFEIETK